MPNWIASLLWCLGSGLLAYTCLQAPWLWARRLGLWMLYTTVALALWFLSGDALLAVGGVALWFVVPAIQALLYSRGLRYSPDRKLVDGPIELEEFPEVNGLTRDLRGEGFVSTGDFWMHPSSIDQGYRFFHHAETGTDAALAVVRQGPLTLSYAILLTIDRQNRFWITWNYPLAYGMKLPPEAMVHRLAEAESLAELWEQHRAFLELNGVEPLPTGEANPRVRFEAFFRSTLEHNHRSGLLSTVKDGRLAYTWKGSALLGWQVFCEVLRG
ncbi:MAG: hypothetical protein SFU85_10885 [Candidatus Methylacidiphilales bacterium]|nr:hypothetical protein [Candidatus Methylacidiphilales bacterium]